MDFTKSKYLLPIFLVWCSGTPIIPAQGIESLYEVEAFRDEFNTDGGPDPSKWKISDSLNSYYKELHYHSPKDSFIRNGSLVLRATNHPHGGANYTAGRLITQGNFDFNLGYVEIRAKLPPGKPFWSGLTLTDYRCRAKGCEDPNTFVVVMNAQAGQPSRDDVVSWRWAGLYDLVAYSAWTAQKTDNNWFSRLLIFAARRSPSENSAKPKTSSSLAARRGVSFKAYFTEIVTYI